jgi:predicted MFS family arabinose efflux permease
MNTVNAAGYLAGALAAPTWLRRFDARRTMLGGGLASGVLLAAHGAVTGETALYALRGLTGLANAAAFIGGSLLAARLAVAGAASGARSGAGLVLGVYYGGTGLGIVASALLVPPLSALPVAHAWQWAWRALGATALVATAVTARATAALRPAHPTAVATAPRGAAWRGLAWALVAYALFGLGYIGYMTFIVTLLREQALAADTIVAFYIVLGLAVIASSWVWAGLLQRQRGGGALALLCGLLALATLAPVLSAHPLSVYGSGVLFGGVFLSVVASTTALVRHNLPSAAWPAGIGAFTTVFAAGQIAGPSLVGWIADHGAGLRGALACSAGLLALGAGMATRQRPLTGATGP